MFSFLFSSYFRSTNQSEYAKADKEYASAKGSGNSEKIAIATGHLKVADEHMRSSEDVLNKGLGDFEHQRVSEMKEFLKRYVRNQIYFHAKSMEGLTAAYQEIVKIDPETEKAIFLRRIREMEFNDIKRGPAAGGLQQPAASVLQSPLNSPMNTAASPSPSPAAATTAAR